MSNPAPWQGDIDLPLIGTWLAGVSFATTWVGALVLQQIRMAVPAVGLPPARKGAGLGLGCAQPVVWRGEHRGTATPARGR